MDAYDFTRSNPQAASSLVDLKVMLVSLVARLSSIPMAAGVPMVEELSAERTSPRLTDRLLTPLAGLVRQYVTHLGQH